MKKIEETKILVVDDEDDVRNYLSAALSDAGFIISTASDGAEALKALENEIPDLISLDLVMPKHSGIQFYRDMKKKKEFSSIPVLIVTGHAHDDLGKVDFDAMTMQGPGIYLEKPVKPAQYVQSVCKILGIDPPEGYITSEPESGDLKDELKKSMENADPDALQRALDALKKK